MNTICWPSTVSIISGLEVRFLHSLENEARLPAPKLPAPIAKYCFKYALIRN